jgi:hypothetical protein
MQAQLEICISTEILMSPAYQVNYIAIVGDIGSCNSSVACTSSNPVINSFATFLLSTYEC